MFSIWLWNMLRKLWELFDSVIESCATRRHYSELSAFKSRGFEGAMSPRPSGQAQVLTNCFGLRKAAGFLLKFSILEGFIARLSARATVSFAGKLNQPIVVVQIRLQKREQLVIEEVMF